MPLLVSTGEYCSGVSVNTWPAAAAPSSQRSNTHCDGSPPGGTALSRISGCAGTEVSSSWEAVASQASGPDARQ